ncbi:hypothetical protein [Paenibacillus tyrfis]|uniref:hypothetical protein n=1 Tax=Paenibacillus tyrfis TaxID=1501230 RepID=UPI0011813AB5|nr:hypothetical protein [Paenibacillus tyrfis]
MKQSLVFILSIVLFLGVPFSTFASYPEDTEVSINFPTTMEPFNSSNVSFSFTGGQVFASNAPESIFSDGAKREDSSVVRGQVNRTLYTDTLTGAFRFWSSHANRSSSTLRFWIVIKNTSAQTVKIYRNKFGYGNAAAKDIGPAAKSAANSFMSASSNPTLIATLSAGDTYKYQYSSDIASHKAMVYFAEFNAINSDGSSASVKVSDVNTTSSISDPIPYTTAYMSTIATTNETSTKSDDYRGLLAHWGRDGIINLNINNTTTKYIKLADNPGYTNEQEQLYTRWDKDGNSINQTPVVWRGKVRNTYWLTDYNITINLTSSTAVSTLFGSAGSAPGHLVYQIDGISKTPKPNDKDHFSKNTARSVSNSKSFILRTMIPASATLPYALYFKAD